MRILSNVLLILLCLPYLGNGATTGAQQITIATAGGSVIQVQPSSDTFMFGVMQPDGTTKPRQFKYDEMDELLLTDNPIANIQADVITLVEQLGDDDFTQRELAEAKLSQSQFAGRFEKLLRNYRDHPNLEIRYRIRRVLASLVDSTTPVPAQDRLILKSGEHFSGDANELRIEGQFLGLPIQLERQQIRQISIANPRTPAPATSKSIKVEKLLSHVDQFYNNGDDFFFDFESDPYGNSISLSERLNDSFYPKGRFFFADEVLELAAETRSLLPEVCLSVTVPHILPLDAQAQLALDLIDQGVDLIQTEGGTSSEPKSPGTLGLIEKAAPTLAATYTIASAIAESDRKVPLICASGLSEVTVAMAISGGASGVGIGSAINKLNNELAMIAAIKSIRQALSSFALIPTKCQ